MKVELTTREIEYLITLMETTFNMNSCSEVRATTYTIRKKLTEQLLVIDKPISCNEFVTKINTGDVK